MTELRFLFPQWNKLTNEQKVAVKELLQLVISFEKISRQLIILSDAQNLRRTGVSNFNNNLGSLGNQGFLATEGSDEGFEILNSEDTLNGIATEELAKILLSQLCDSVCKVDPNSDACKACQSLLSPPLY